MKDFLFYILLPAALASSIIYGLLWFFYHMKLFYSKEKKASKNLRDIDKFKECLNSIGIEYVENSNQPYSDYNFINLNEISDSPRKTLCFEFKDGKFIKYNIVDK